MVQISGKYSGGDGRYDKLPFPLWTVKKEHLDILKKFKLLLFLFISGQNRCTESRFEIFSKLTPVFAKHLYDIHTFVGLLGQKSSRRPPFGGFKTVKTTCQ